MTGFPNIVGLIDGTHIAIAAVRRNVENGYVNHHGFYSINTQLVLKYTYIIYKYYI